MREKIHSIENEFKSKIIDIKTLKGLESLKSEFIGKSGKINTLTKELKNIGLDKRKEFGGLINKLKESIEYRIGQKYAHFKSQRKNEKWVDWTIPGIKPQLGCLHPTTKLIRELNEFFKYFGYSIAEGPEIETDEYNFEKLNLPKDHPARDLQDTLYIKSPNILMRTHTSSVETRTMVNYGPPIRIVAPGKCFRNETTNKSNNVVFYHYEALVIDKGISMAHLKWSVLNYVQLIFGKDAIIRFRCKYYPQVEPGMGIDIKCKFCKGKGCIVCKYVGWLEIGGSGMVHPNVLRSCGIDPKEWSGFAFGMSPDRSVMQRYGINDIRKLYNGSIVYK